MKIEKVNSNQIKCILNKGDLLSREIKVSELAYGTEKAQELFKDMMDQASSEFGFEANNVPLMIEAVPLSTDSIMLIITKVENPEELEDKFTGVPVSDARKFKKKSTISKEEALNSTGPDEPISINIPSYMVYSFDKLDPITDIAPRLLHYPIDSSSLYLDREEGKYYLILSMDSIERNVLRVLRGALSDYGEPVPFRVADSSYYDEHSELLIKDNALKALVAIGG